MADNAGLARLLVIVISVISLAILTVANRMAGETLGRRTSEPY